MAIIDYKRLVTVWNLGWCLK